MHTFGMGTYNVILSYLDSEVPLAIHNITITLIYMHKIQDCKHSQIIMPVLSIHHWHLFTCSSTRIKTTYHI